MRKWEELPVEMQVEELKPYYEALKRKRLSLFIKRVFDFTISFLMLVILFPVFLIIAVAIKIDSSGSVFFRQVRVTQYGRQFRIFKFRTMFNNTEKSSTQVTTANDDRITQVGKIIRKYRLDETAQLINIISGDMTFVGTRPEVVKYVECYTSEMLATLLLPAGVTNLTCIYYRDEGRLLSNSENIDKVYVEEVLPDKMKWNLDGIMNFSLLGDTKLMLMTFLAMLGKEYVSDKEMQTRERVRL